MSSTREKSVPGKTGHVRASAGVVQRQIHRFRSEAGGLTPDQLIHAIDRGLPVRELEELRMSLDLPMDKFAPRLGISLATLQRRKQQGRLDPGESDRVLRFARLMGMAVAVFGDKKDARDWLNSPQFGLGGAVPLDYAKSEVGAREVENLLGRIEHGVYS
jgi:putative toxin-antitoxin system antitoxin component (TIGR02293 family)